MSNLFMHINGQCPYCNGPVNIVEGLVFDYTLDNDGYPKILNTESYKVAGYCEKCAKELLIMPNDNGGYNAYPPISGVDLVFQSNINNKRMSIFGNRLMTSEDNPFINIAEDDECPF